MPYLQVQVEMAHLVHPKKYVARLRAATSSSGPFVISGRTALASHEQRDPALGFPEAQSPCHNHVTLMAHCSIERMAQF